jgi:hypothetical protein
MVSSFRLRDIDIDLWTLRLDKPFISSQRGHMPAFPKNWALMDQGS